MYFRRGKRVISILVTAMMLANMAPAVCYAEEAAESIESVSVGEEAVCETGAESEDTAEIQTAEEKEAVSDEQLSETAESETTTVETETPTTETEATTVETETASETETEEFDKAYVLTAAEYEEKERLAEVLPRYLDAVEGVDYEAGIVIKLVDDKEKAEEIAKLYDAELLDFGLGVAEYRLSDKMSVKDALILAADTTNCYPAVYPNLIGRNCGFSEVRDISAADASDNTGVADGNTTSEEEIELQSDIVDVAGYMDDWLFENEENGYYQWYHDLIGTPYAWNNEKRGLE